MLHLVLVLVLWMADASVLRKPNLFSSDLLTFSKQLASVQLYTSSSEPQTSFPALGSLQNVGSCGWHRRLLRSLLGVFLQELNSPLTSEFWQGRLTMRPVLVSFSARTVVRGISREPCFRAHLTI
jgi:hypothetical protein